MTDLVIDPHQDAAGTNNLVIDPHLDAEEMINELIIEPQILEDMSLAELRKIGYDLNLTGRNKTKLIYAIRERRMNRAIRNGKLEEAKELHYKYGIELTSHSINNAIRARDVIGVRWLLERGGKPDSNSIGTAIINGGLISIIRELLKAGAECSSRDLILAIRRGYVELLKFLNSVGVECPRPQEIYTKYTYAYRPEMIKYLYSIGVRIEDHYLKHVMKILKTNEKHLKLCPVYLEEVMEVRKFLEEQHGLTQ